MIEKAMSTRFCLWLRWQVRAIEGDGSYAGAVEGGGSQTREVRAGTWEPWEEEKPPRAPDSNVVL